MEITFTINSQEVSVNQTDRKLDQKLEDELHYLD